MYSKAKRGVAISAVIVFMVLALLELISGILDLVNAIGLGNVELSLTVIILSVLDILVALTCGVIIILFCKKPRVLEDGSYSNRKKLVITTLVLLGLIFILEIICFCGVGELIFVLHRSSILCILSFIVCLAGLTLFIIEICLKGSPYKDGQYAEDGQSEFVSQPKSKYFPSEIDRKIAELKCLLDKGLIGSDKYNEILEQTIREFVQESRKW